LANQEREQQSKDREKALSMWEKSRMEHKRLLNEIEIMKKEKLILKQQLADQTDFQVYRLRPCLCSYLISICKQLAKLSHSFCLDS